MAEGRWSLSQESGMVCQNYFLQVARAGMYVARQQANEVNLNGTSGDNESVHHHAD